MKTVYLEKNDIAATLTTWIYCAFAQAWAAEKNGLIPYIHWPKGGLSLHAYQDDAMFKQEPNMYNWFFTQPFNEEVLPPRDLTWTWEFKNWGHTEPVSDAQFMGQPLQVIRDYYKKHLHFNAVTDNRGQMLVTKYGIDFKKTIGITWRGTDVYLDGRPRMPIETYFPWIDDILEKEPDMRIACTAEETEILNPLLARYSQAFVIEEFESSPHGSLHNPERLSTKSGYERGLQPALMVWLFSKCAHYIKNRSSTGAVASWISDGRIVSLGHPENLGFPANTDTVEIEGKLYPLNR